MVTDPHYGIGYKSHPGLGAQEFGGNSQTIGATLDLRPILKFAENALLAFGANCFPINCRTVGAGICWDKRDNRRRG